MRDTLTVLWSLISLASLWASSTGCTLDLKARPKIPSTIFSMCFSIDVSTFNDGSLRGRIRRDRRDAKDYHTFLPGGRSPQASGVLACGHSCRRRRSPPGSALGLVPDGIAGGHL